MSTIRFIVGIAMTILFISFIVYTSSFINKQGNKELEAQQTKDIIDSFNSQ